MYCFIEYIYSKSALKTAKQVLRLCWAYIVLFTFLLICCCLSLVLLLVFWMLV